MTKCNFHNRKKGGAALAAAALVLSVLLFTGCPNNAGGGGGNNNGGGTPTPAYTQVAYGTNGADLQAWLTNNAAAAPAVNYIELTGVTRDHLSGSVGNPSPLGKIIQDSGKKVALKLPETVDRIGDRAFYKCTALTGIDLSACTHLWAGAKIYGYAFADCTELKTVTFGGARFLEIEQFAFAGCTALSSADMSGCPSLEKIDMWAFQDCTALKELRLPKKLTTIGTDAFKNCPIETLVIHCDIENKAGEDTIVKNLTQTASVKQHLKTLTLGAGVTKIGEKAFYDCTTLEAADFSACTALTQIGQQAFSGCVLRSADLSRCTQLTQIKVATFLACTELTAVKLPATLTKIEDSAFEGCMALSSVDLSGCTSLTTIGEVAFNECTKAVIKLPGSITTIASGSQAFGSSEGSWCEKVLIPSSHAATIKPLVTGSGYPADRIGSY